MFVCSRCRGASRHAAAGRARRPGSGRQGAAARSASGDDDGGRCFVPPSLRCSPRGRAAQLAALAALAARAPLKHSAASQMYEARFARRPRGCAARRRRHRPKRCAPPPLACRCPASERAPLPHAALETSVVHALKTGPSPTSTATVSAKARATAWAVRGGCALCAAEKRRSAGRRAQRASSIILAAISLSGARAASVASFAAQAGAASIAGTPPREAGGQAPGARAADGPRRRPRLCPRRRSH